MSQRCSSLERMFDQVELEELCFKVAGADAGIAADDELMGAAVVLERTRGLLESAQAHVLDQLHLRAVTDREFGHRVGPWLAQTASAPKARCKGRAKTAEKLLGWFAEFDTAVVDGKVGWEHAELLCNVANVRNHEGLAEAQEHLIILAAQFSFEHWAALVRQLAEELDEDGGYDPNDDVHANRLCLSPNADRTIEVGGRLVGDARVSVRETLESIADELYVRFTRDHEADPSLEVPSRPSLLALALVEVCRRSGAVDIESSQQPRTEAVIVIEQGTDGAELRSPDGQRLPDSAANLLVDPVLRGLIIDGEGNPLRYGRARRLATPAQRAAITVRDGGCVFPGCDMPPGWCDVHHQPPWREGGRTDIDAMALLCRRHHGVTHRNDWVMKPDPDRPQRWKWNTPGGRTIRSQRRRDQAPPRL